MYEHWATYFGSRFIPKIHSTPVSLFGCCSKHKDVSRISGTNPFWWIVNTIVAHKDKTCKGPGGKNRERQPKHVLGREKTFDAIRTLYSVARCMHWSVRFVYIYVYVFMIPQYSTMSVLLFCSTIIHAELLKGFLFHDMSITRYTYTVYNSKFQGKLWRIVEAQNSVFVMTADNLGLGFFL